MFWFTELFVVFHGVYVFLQRKLSSSLYNSPKWFFCRACSVMHFLICVSFEIYWPPSQFERLLCWLPHSWLSFASKLEIHCSMLFCFLVFLWKTWAFSVIYAFVCELVFFFSVTLLVLYPWHLDYYISWKGSLARSVWSLKAFCVWMPSSVSRFGSLSVIILLNSFCISLDFISTSSSIPWIRSGLLYMS